MHSYTTFDAALTVNFPDESELVALSFPLDCGPFELSWDQTVSASQTALDVDVFTLDETERKISAYSEDNSKAETYSMSYTVSLS